MKIFLLGLLTLISGSISALAFNDYFSHGQTGWLPFFLIPGITFGLAISVYFYLEAKISFKKILILNFFSVLAWVIAFWVSFLGLSLGMFIIVSGLLGGTIISFSTHKILPQVRPLYPIIAGGLAGVVFSYLFSLEHVSIETPKPQLYLAFIIWHMAVGLTLGFTWQRGQRMVNTGNSMNPASMAPKIDKHTVWGLIAVGIFIVVTFFWMVSQACQGGGCH